MVFDTFEKKQLESAKYLTRSGFPTLDQYEYKVDDKGVKRLVKNGKKEDVHARIQADYESTDINKLMVRFSLGDESAINVRQGFFADVTQMPTNYAELFDRAVQAEQYFEKLPTDLKELFNNSASEFFAAYGTKEFDSQIAKYNEKFDNHQFDVKSTDDLVIEKEGVTEINHE